MHKWTEGINALRVNETSPGSIARNEGFWGRRPQRGSWHPAAGFGRNRWKSGIPPTPSVVRLP